MNTLAERLTKARELAQLSQDQLARKAGVSQGTIGNAESGLRKLPRELPAIADALDVRYEWLRHGKGEMLATQQFMVSEDSGTGYGNVGFGRAQSNDLVPVISWVRAGEFDEAHDPFHPGDADEWRTCPTNHGPHTYALRVDGDSMTAPYGRSYPNGCLIFVDPDQRSPANGARIIAKLEGSADVTFKCFQSEGGKHWLKPLNPQHPPIMEQFKIIGTVIGKWEDE